MQRLTTHTKMTLLAIVVLAVGSSGLARSVSAQSDAELRRENQRLRTEVDEITRELEAARQRISDLEQMMQSLQRQLAEARSNRRTGSGGTEAEEEKLSIDETEADASPRSLLKAVKESYAEALGDMEVGAPDSRERQLFMNHLERWKNGADRMFRLSVEWTVTIKNLKPHANGKDWLLELQAVDPKYGTELGDTFVGLLPANRKRNLEAGLAGQWVIRGRVIPNLTFNPNRLEVGTFDSPPFVGPMVEFGFGVEVTTIVEAKPVQDDGGGE